ncbi:MAG: phosphoglycerate kinase [Nitrospiraceae bacterium]|nr:phosphoglycerate kinase [Nitrospiraceae bacterium]
MGNAVIEEKKLPGTAEKERLSLIQDAPIEGKTVLVRFDHNVVKDGVIRDPYRIDRSLGTLYNIVERGGRPVMMTHIGRPKDKSGKITCKEGESVMPVVEYLERKLHVKFFVPEFRAEDGSGIKDIDTSINHAIRSLRDRKIGGIYLPNTRWFQGEQAKDRSRERFALQLAGLADLFVNDAFGSWQPHVSTYDITKHLPSYAGYLMQEEIDNLKYVLAPQRPFLAVVAGAKYDTKIRPLYALYKKADNLILGGVIYNTYLAAKYGINIKGVLPEDVTAARALVEEDRKANKIIELPHVVESDTLEGRIEGKYRKVPVRDFKKGASYGYFLDIAAESFSDADVTEKLHAAKTIFVNAVMGFTPHFTEGSKALDESIDRNTAAKKLYGGGDTLQEFKNLLPGLYLSVLDNTQYYFFTGGGTVLTAIEQGSPYGLEPVKALMGPL